MNGRCKRDFRKTFGENASYLLSHPDNYRYHMPNRTKGLRDRERGQDELKLFSRMQYNEPLKHSSEGEGSSKRSERRNTHQNDWTACRDVSSEETFCSELVLKFFYQLLTVCFSCLCKRYYSLDSGNIGFPFRSLLRLKGCCVGRESWRQWEVLEAN